MEVLVSDPYVVEELIEQRRRNGAERYDEMWKGILHVNPLPTGVHQDIVQQLSVIFDQPARDAGLFVRPGVNIGEPDDYRGPDSVLQRERLPGLWHETAALAVEVRSPRDATWKKFPHYAEHGVDEFVVIEPEKRSVQWFALADGEYVPTERSTVIPLGPSELAAQLDWPPLED